MCLLSFSYTILHAKDCQTLFGDLQLGWAYNLEWAPYEYTKTKDIN
jgi:hypothetical protein